MKRPIETEETDHIWAEWAKVLSNRISDCEYRDPAEAEVRPERRSKHRRCVPVVARRHATISPLVSTRSVRFKTKRDVRFVPSAREFAAEEKAATWFTVSVIDGALCDYRISRRSWIITKLTKARTNIHISPSHLHNIFYVLGSWYRCEQSWVLWGREGHEARRVDWWNTNDGARSREAPLSWTPYRAEKEEGGGGPFCPRRAEDSAEAWVLLSPEPPGSESHYKSTLKWPSLGGRKIGRNGGAGGHRGADKEWRYALSCGIKRGRTLRLRVYSSDLDGYSNGVVSAEILPGTVQFKQWVSPPPNSVHMKQMTKVPSSSRVCWVDGLWLEPSLRKQGSVSCVRSN